ncbi:MAG: hypothetical protein LBC97_02375 [Bifidobacteriaceae bacterium]|jgi:hypothetical protein|nr:hypothetical protein [Bifidobacteriaceae bacterium]
MRKCALAAWLGRCEGWFLGITGRRLGLLLEASESAQYEGFVGAWMVGGWLR